MHRVRQAVCTISDLLEGLGKVVPLGNAGTECALYLIDGKVYATGSVCPHQNTSLEQSMVESGEIICRKHGYRFDPKTGDCLTIGGYGLPVYDVQVDAGTVFVSYWDFED